MEHAVLQPRVRKSALMAQLLLQTVLLVRSRQAHMYSQVVERFYPKLRKDKFASTLQRVKAQPR